MKNSTTPPFSAKPATSLNEKRFEFPELFKHRGERWLVVGLILIAICLPLLISALDPDKELRFRGPATESENFPFYRQQIFDEKDPVDVLFVGPCTVWWQVETEPIRQSLEQSWGRPVNVLNFGYNHSSNDISYLLVKEILERRKVKYLVLTTPRISDEMAFPHPNAYQWWMYPQDSDRLTNLSIIDRARLYAVSVMGSFRILPMLFSPRLEYKMRDESYAQAKGTKIRNAVARGQSWTLDWTPESALFTKSPENLELMDEALPQVQMQLLEAIVKLATEGGAEVIWLSSPLKEDFEWESTGLRERADWLTLFPTTKLISLPPAWIKRDNPNWSLMIDAHSLTPEAAKWMSAKWAQVFARLPDR